VSGLPGIIEARASYPKRSVVVRYDPAVVTPAEIAGVIVTGTYFTVGEPVAGGELSEDGSIAVAGSTAVIKVEGMTDDRTASLVTQAVGGVGPPVLLPGTEPAIRDVSLDTAQSTLTVTFDSEQVSAEELVDAVQQGTEFQATLVSTAGVGGGGGTDYTPYVVIAIAGLFVAALAWPAVSWGRRRLAEANAASRSRRRGSGGGERDNRW